MSGVVSRVRWIPVVGVIVVSVTLVACATIINGTTQNVGISSQPGGAQVTVNGNDLGQTPLIAELKRKNEHFVTVALDGYEPYEITITKSASGWVFGNIIFGGLIGLAVDAITGGLYKLSPEAVNAELIQAADMEDGVFITVVLAPDPDWVRIGTLESSPLTFGGYYGFPR